MAPIVGTVASGNVESYSLVPDIGKLRLLEKSAARFLGFLMRARKKVRRVKRREDYGIQERRPRTRSTKFTNAINTTELDWTLDDVSFITAEDILEVPSTGEQVQVKNVNYNTKVVTVKERALGGTATAVAAGKDINRSSRNFAEGFTAGSSWVTETVKRTNNVETIATPVEWTKDQLKEMSYLSPDQRSSRMKQDQEAMAIEHVRDVNRALIFHKKGKRQDSSGNTMLLMDGMIAQCGKTYNHTDPENLSEDAFLTNIGYPLFENGDGMEKVLGVSNKVLGYFESWGRENRRFVDKSEKFDLGFPVGVYRCTRGELIIYHEPELDVPYYEYSLFGFDADYIQYVDFSETEYEENIGDKKTAKRLDQWVTQPSLEVTYKETAIFAYNLNGT